MIGTVIKDYPRDSFVIATKIPGRPYNRQTGLFTEETTGEDFIKKFSESLERLGLDYVDILYLHNSWKREATLFEPLMKAMAAIKKEGRARFLGVSTHRNEPEVIQAAIDSRFYDVILTSYNFKQDHHLEIKKAIADAAAVGIGIVGMKALAGGYLDEEKAKPVDAKAALKWVLQDKNVRLLFRVLQPLNKWKRIYLSWKIWSLTKRIANYWNLDIILLEEFIARVVKPV